MVLHVDRVDGKLASQTATSKSAPTRESWRARDFRSCNMMKSHLPATQSMIPFDLRFIHRCDCVPLVQRRASYRPHNGDHPRVCNPFACNGRCELIDDCINLHRNRDYNLVSIVSVAMAPPGLRASCFPIEDNPFSIHRTCSAHILLRVRFKMLANACDNSTKQMLRSNRRQRCDAGPDGNGIWAMWKSGTRSIGCQSTAVQRKRFYCYCV